MLKFFKRIGLLLDICEIFVVRELGRMTKEQDQKITQLTEDIEYAKTYCNDAIEEIVKIKVLIGDISNEEVADNVSQLQKYNYDQLKCLRLDYKFRTVMLGKPGNA